MLVSTRPTVGARLRHTNSASSYNYITTSASQGSTMSAYVCKVSLVVAISISAVKIKIERVKVKKRLENSCNTNILMFYLEVGGGERVKEASGFSVIKHQDGKGCFCFPFCSFQWLYSNVVLCTKPYYAWHGEKCAIWLLFLRLFIPVYFEFSQP